MNNVYMFVGKLVVYNIAIDLTMKGVTKGVKYTTNKVKEIKENLKVKEVKNGKKSEDYVDVEYGCTYC